MKLPITIEGGTVLRFVGVYEDISAFILTNGKPKSSLRFKKNVPTPLEHGPRYAKCIRFGNVPGGEIVFVPITETGRFYVMAKRSNELSYNHVYSFSQLLRLVKLPVTVQLVTGPRPRNYPNCDIFQANLPTNFSAVLRLEEIRVRDVILGCTLRPQTTINSNPDRSSALSSIRRTWRGNRSNIKTEDKPVLLEFDLDSGFSFFRTFVERNGTLSSRKIPELVIQRIGYCDAEADSWRRQIKLAHDIITKEDHHQPTLPCYRKARKSLFESGVIPDNLPRCEIDKLASIGSRTSSGVSTVSRLSKIIQKFWSPLKKGSTVSGFRSKTERDFDLGEFEDIEEDVNGEESSRIIINKDVNSRSKAVVDQHHYETLKKCDEVKFFPPKQKLTRKQTLDVIFADLDVSSDKQPVDIIATPSSEDEPAYSTIE
uniref:Uncharacterized protein n=1 Tax=Tetranychus urticae TaxID=32264 RepID=T1K5E8_TETUR